VFLIRSDAGQSDAPFPEDIYLLIEVADSSIARDMDLKLKLYARDGIREFWIVNLKADQLEVYREPDGERYATSFTLKSGELATCLEFPSDAIDWP
jgi:Uma2 family endonuclease